MFKSQYLPNTGLNLKPMNASVFCSILLISTRHFLSLLNVVSYLSVVFEDGDLVLPSPRKEAVRKASMTGGSRPFLGGSTITTLAPSSQLMGDYKTEQQTEFQKLLRTHCIHHHVKNLQILKRELLRELTTEASAQCQLILEFTDAGNRDKDCSNDSLASLFTSTHFTVLHSFHHTTQLSWWQIPVLMRCARDWKAEKCWWATCICEWWPGLDLWDPHQHTTQQQSFLSSLPFGASVKAHQKPTRCRPPQGITLDCLYNTIYWQ